MSHILTRLLAAVVVLTVTAGTAQAAGARVTWREQFDADHFKLFVAQPDGDAPTLLEFTIRDPQIAEDGSFYYDVHGIDPLRPTFFLMVGVDWLGISGPGSNILELGEKSFCEGFDVDGDGEVTPIDALAVARKALGLAGDDIPVEGSIITALEILRMAAALQCV
jgi:hypothetical protein